MIDLKLPAIHLRWAKRDPYLYISLIAEFLGVLLFQLLAGSGGDDPLQSGFIFAGLLYATKYVSGGHLNPAVSLAATLSGHIDFVRGFSYITAQLLGGIAGAMIQAWINPDSAFGQVGPGCFVPVKDLSHWGLLGWETLLTLLFVVVMYTSVFIRPGHGDASPLAAGLTLFGALATGGALTGGSPLNPARTLAGSLVFRCFGGWALVYISAQLTGAVLAAAWAILAFGKGSFFLHPSAEGSLRESLVGGGVAGDIAPGGAFHPVVGHGYAGALQAMGGEMSTGPM